MFFSDHQRFHFSDSSLQLMTGAVMCPDKVLLQKDRETGEIYQCYFSEATVRKCSQLFMKNNIGKTTNIDHGLTLPTNEVSGIYAVESWISDGGTEKGMPSAKGEWWCSYKIENANTFEGLKATCTGFSIEGDFFRRQVANIQMESISERDIENELNKILDSDLPSEEKIKKIASFVA